MSLFRDLYRHMEWADATVWRVVLDSSSGQGDGFLRERLHHIHLVQRAFFNVWKQLPMQFPELSSFADLAALSAWGSENYPQIAEFIEAVDQARLDDIVVLPWAQRLTERFGSPAETRLGETLLQVPMHSQYHRGQVNIRLRELGAEPPLVDYIAWIWLGRPEAGWPI